MHKQNSPVINQELSRDSDTSIPPGQYQFRPASIAPWLNVRVFRESIDRRDSLRVRWAGVEMDANRWIRRGEWKPV